MNKNKTPLLSFPYILMLLGVLSTACSVALPLWKLSGSGVDEFKSILGSLGISFKTDGSMLSACSIPVIGELATMVLVCIIIVCLATLVFVLLRKPILVVVTNFVSIIVCVITANTIINIIPNVIIPFVTNLAKEVVSTEASDGSGFMDKLKDMANGVIDFASAKSTEVIVSELESLEIHINPGLAVFVWSVGSVLGIVGAVLALKAKSQLRSATEQETFNAAETPLAVEQFQKPQEQEESKIRTVIPQEEKVITPTEQQSPIPVVASFADQHRGMKVSVQNREVLIGRDREANIVYKDGTAGVSGRHCKLSYDQGLGKFVLTDLGSTYGTFLSDGRKLQPNVPQALKPGDSFYVGDKNNVLRVELNA